MQKMLYCAKFEKKTANVTECKKRNFSKDDITNPLSENQEAGDTFVSYNNIIKFEGIIWMSATRSLHSITSTQV